MDEIDKGFMRLCAVVPVAQLLVMLLIVPIPHYVSAVMLLTDLVWMGAVLWEIKRSDGDVAE